MKQKAILTSVLLVLTFTINSQNSLGRSEKIKGNGKIITKNTSVTAFDSFFAGGSFNIILVKGIQPTISIHGEENIIPYIETEVSKKKLSIKYKKNTTISSTKDLTITVTYTNLQSVSLGGSGSINATETIKNNHLKILIGGAGTATMAVDVDDLNATIAGSGNLFLKGKTNNFNTSIAGSGTIEAYQVITKELEATIAGSGSIKATVNTKLKTKIVGSGNVYYKGKPTKIDSKSVGSGTIIEKN